MRPALSVLSLALLLATAGCGVTPKAGDYVLEVSDLVVDDRCEAWDIEDEGLFDFMEMKLNADADRLTMFGVDLMNRRTLECDLDGAEFDCASQNFYGPEGTEQYALMVSIEAEGRWKTPKRFVSEWEQHFYCEGTTCGGALDRCDVGYSITGKLE